MAYAILSGQMDFALAFFLIPVIYGSSLIGGVAIGMIILGIFIWMTDTFLHTSRTVEDPPGYRPGQVANELTKREFGGVVLIGPIPIVFGSSTRAALYAAIAAVVVLIILLAALFFL